MITVNDIPVQSQGFIIRKLGEETILISENGKNMHTLDEIGGFIWENIDGKNSISSITERICDEYDVNRSIAEKDILEFIEKLIEKELILIKNK